MDPLSPWVCLLCSRMRSSIAIRFPFSLCFKAIDDDDAWWDFGGNGYGDAEASIIAKALENDETSATQLNLMGMSLGQSHGQKSCTINSRHRPIYVSANVVFPALDNGIGEAGLQVIAKMMEGNSTVITVDLGGNSGVDEKDSAACKEIKLKCRQNLVSCVCACVCVRVFMCPVS